MECGSHFGVDGQLQFRSSECVQSERDLLLTKVATLRDLVREAYEEGADDCSRDEDNFMRSNAKATLDDLE